MPVPNTTAIRITTESIEVSLELLAGTLVHVVFPLQQHFCDSSIRLFEWLHKKKDNMK